MIMTVSGLVANESVLKEQLNSLGALYASLAQRIDNLETMGRPLMRPTNPRKVTPLQDDRNLRKVTPLQEDRNALQEDPRNLRKVAAKQEDQDLFETDGITVV